MGQAKNRGTYEQRRAAAMEREAKQFAARVEIDRRKPSPKRMANLSMLAALACALNANDGVHNDKPR